MTAKEYLAAGFVVFPVGLSYNEEKSGKEGKVKKDLAPEPGFTKLTLETARRLSFTRNAIGLLTGFGVMALDIDNVNLWDHILSELGESEPETCKSISQSGGRHLLFKVTPELERLRRHGVFGFKKIGRDDFDILGKGDFLLVPPSSFMTPLEKREYTFVEGYSLLDNPEKLIEAPEWLLQVLTPGSVPHNRVRATFLRQDLAKKAEKRKEEEKEQQEQEVKDKQGQKRKGEDTQGGRGTSTKRARSASVSSDEGYTPEEEALIALDAEDRLKEVAKHVKKLRAERAIDRQSWIEVGMAIHHATDGSAAGMELWDKFSRRAGPYDRRTLEYQWDSLKNGSGITLGSLKHWAREDGKATRVEKKREKAEEEKMKADDGLRREAVKFSIDHTGGKGVFEGWDGEKSVAVIKNTMHHPNHHVKCMFSRAGAFQQCTECEWRHPFAGQLMVPQTEYPLLHQQFFNITINNTVNNYNNQETDIAWNEFKEDSLQIVSDPETNDLLLAALSGTHARVADLAYHLYGSGFAFEKTWYRFTGVVWKKDPEQIWVRDCLKARDFLCMFVEAKAAFLGGSNIKDQDRKVKQIQKVINSLENHAFKGSVVSELTTMVGKRSEGFADNLDKNRDLLAFNNGVYDLKKGAFRAAEPEDYLTIMVGYDFEAKRDAVVEAKIHDFLDKVFPNPEVKKYTLKFLASTLAGHTSDQLFHFGHGSGSNGKGVLNNLMDLTLGHYAGRMDASFLCSKIKEADAPTPTLTKLVGRRFVYISECVDGSKINEQTFKQLCGEDKLTFRPLHGEQVDFHPDFKLFMVCNNLPKFNGTEYSMRRRLRVIPFVSSFKGQDELVGSASTAKVFLKNPRLNEEIKEWRMSFMHLLLDHYQVYKTETLEPEPATMKAAARTWIRDNDSVARFIEDRCTFGPDEKVHWRRVWTAYLDWKATVPDISNHYSGKQTFFDAIKPKIWNCHGVVKKDSLNINGDSRDGVLGFGLKDLYL